MGHFVSFDQVSKIYRMGEVTIKAADKISFEIDKGEFCVIVGPSGAGKTTVLNMRHGYLRRRHYSAGWKPDQRL